MEFVSDAHNDIFQVEKFCSDTHLFLAKNLVNVYQLGKIFPMRINLKDYRTPRWFFYALLACLFHGKAYATDTYDPVTGILSIPVVRVGDIFYKDVKVRAATTDVVSVGQVAALANYDTYSANTGQLTISSVLVGSRSYSSVVVNVRLGSVIAATRVVPDSNLARLVDNFMTPYLATNGITAATITVMNGSLVLYEKAYGHKDSARTTPLSADALMTTASIVKPVTAAAIQKLIAAGKVGSSDKVFCGPGVSPSTENNCWVDASWVTSTDSRIRSITVSHLLSHTGGWNRAGTGCAAYQLSDAATRNMLAEGGSPCDVIQHEAIIQAALGLASPPTLEQDVRFFMRANLDFTPGNKLSNSDRYSNFGYMLLGLIVEKASGQTYIDFVNTQILNPLGIPSGDFKMASSLLVSADSREPNYVTTKIFPSVFAPGTLVSARNGTINAANFVAAAASITTSKAMATFASMYRIDVDASGNDDVNNGRPLLGATNTGRHRGDLPGTSTVVAQLSSGISYSVLMNKNDKYEGIGVRKDYFVDVTAGVEAAITAAGY